MSIKIRSIILSISVAVFMIVMGNCFARPVDYKVDLPKEYSVHFLCINDKDYSNLTYESGGLKKTVWLPKEAYWMTKSNKDFICFMDDEDNVYVGLRWYGVCEGVKLWKININTGKQEVVWNIYGLGKMDYSECGIIVNFYGGIDLDVLYIYELKTKRLPDGRYYIEFLRKIQLNQ